MAHRKDAVEHSCHKWRGGCGFVIIRTKGVVVGIVEDDYIMERKITLIDDGWLVASMKVKLEKVRS